MFFEKKLNKKSLGEFMKNVCKKNEEVCGEMYKKTKCFVQKLFGWGTKKTEGFTFVETIAVLAIGTILTAGSAMSATKFIKSAKETAARNQISEFSAALQSYFIDCGRFPTSEQGIKALWQKPSLYPVPENWNGPYVMREPGADPWGTEYEYVNAENANFPSDVPESLPYIIICYGADKEKGGEGNGEDIVSWK